MTVSYSCVHCYGDIIMKIEKSKFVDLLVYLLIAVITVNFMCGLDYSNCSFVVVFLFTIIGAYSFIKIAKSKANIDIRRNFYIFVYIFFFLAPLQQYTQKNVLWNGTGLKVMYNNTNYLRGILAVAVMIVAFEFGYSSRKVRIKDSKTYCQSTEVQMKPLYLKEKSLLLLLVVSTVSFAFLVATHNIANDNNVFGTSSLAVQLLNIIKFLPVSCMIMALIYAMNYGFKKKTFYAIMALEVAIIYAPIWGNMARFILFGTYIVFLTLFFSESKYKSLYFLALFMGLCFAFSSLRHATNPFLFLHDLSMDFSHVDYDAFQMLMNAQEYVEQQGIYLLKNIISAMAFLIPRTVWKGKMEGTGALIARYFGSWQENVSMPLVAEIYVAGGWVGTVVLSFLLGKIVKNLDNLRFSNNYMKRAVFCLISGMTMYIMRGSLLVAFAYTGGLILSMLFIYQLCRTRI